MIKKVFLILILIILCMCSANYVQASDIISGADDFISVGKGQTPLTPGNLQNASNKVYSLLLTIGTVIAVIVAAILGIQFMTGSVEQKSKVKEAFIPFAIGCVVIFGAFGIWDMVIRILR